MAKLTVGIGDNIKRLERPITNTRPVFINVSGLLFETRSQTLSKFPQTLLGNVRKRMEFYSYSKNEYFFNRDRESFESILFFYQSSGKLYRPVNVNMLRFIEECEFFQLPEWAIELMQLNESGGALREHLHHVFCPEPKRERTLRTVIWELLEYPKSSKCAKCFAYFYLLLLLASIIISCLETMKGLELSGTAGGYVMELLDIGINAYFLLEFMVKLTVSPNKYDFFKNVMVWLDLFALIPFIADLFNERYRSNPEHTGLRPLRILRVIRICRFYKMFSGINVTVIVFKNSLDDIKLFIASFSVCVVFVGAVVYNLENIQKESFFSSIPEGMYWGIQTCTTLGYGDIIPESIIGRLFASVVIFIAVPILSIPAMSIITKFTIYQAMLSQISESEYTD